jgi:hypothetical protein
LCRGVKSLVSSGQRERGRQCDTLGSEQGFIRSIDLACWRRRFHRKFSCASRIYQRVHSKSKQGGMGSGSSDARYQGYVATCSANYLWLHTINARPIARLDLTSSAPRSLSPYVTSIAFHEREYSDLGILATGHADGSVALYTWNAHGTPKGSRAQWEFLKVTDLEADKSTSASATALKFVG